MTKSFSTRLNESTVQRIDLLARRLRKSKKAVIEGAIDAFAERLEGGHQADVFDQTTGAWRRKETPARTAQRARRAFRESLERGGR